MGDIWLGTYPASGYMEVLADAQDACHAAGPVLFRSGRKAVNMLPYTRPTRSKTLTPAGIDQLQGTDASWQTRFGDLQVL